MFHVGIHFMFRHCAGSWGIVKNKASRTIQVFLAFYLKWFPCVHSLCCSCGGVLLTLRYTFYSREHLSGALLLNLTVGR